MQVKTIYFGPGGSGSMLREDSVDIQSKNRILYALPTQLYE
jgi:hypothetical protein